MSCTVTMKRNNSRCTPHVSSSAVGTCKAFTQSGFALRSTTSFSLNPLNLVLHVRVQLTQTVNLLISSIPVSAAVGLQKGRHELAERVGVGVHHAGGHLGILDERRIGLVVYPSVHLCLGWLWGHHRKCMVTGHLSYYIPRFIRKQRKNKIKKKTSKKHCLEQTNVVQQVGKQKRAKRKGEIKKDTMITYKTLYEGIPGQRWPTSPACWSVAFGSHARPRSQRPSCPHTTWG